MISLSDKQKCTGCMACFQTCPVKCISVREDDIGHLYPYIDRDTCIECKSCVKVCPEISINQKEALKKTDQAYAVWSLNTNSRLASTSGGAAAEFYESALSQGYWICGVKYEEQYHVRHSLTKDQKEISAYRQSKYVYSETVDIYRKIKELLQKEEKVLFISLPCKVAGLYSFLGDKLAENLLTVDIVCHGTPPYAQLKEHIKKVAILDHGQLTFRKDNEYIFEVTDNNEIVYSKTGRQDNYLAAFLEALNYRLSCYNCSYARPERISDITIGDFWGLGAEIPWNHPYTGSISAVLINTEKGRKFWDECSDRFFSEERSVEEAVKGNAQLNHPTPAHPKRAEFEALYKQKGFDEAVQICLKDEIKQDRKKQNKVQFRRKLRKIAGIVIPRYRR